MNHKYVLFLSQKKKKNINMFFYEGFEVLLFCSFNGFLDELVTLFAICQHVDALSSIFFFFKEKKSYVLFINSRNNCRFNISFF